MAIRSNFSQLSFITEMPGEVQSWRKHRKIKLSCEKERSTERLRPGDRVRSISSAVLCGAMSINA